MSSSAGARKGKAKPRIALSVPEDLKADYDFISDVMGVATTRLILDVMQEARSNLLAVADAVEAAKKDSTKGLDLMNKLIVENRQIVADTQLDLEDAIAADKKRKRRK